MIFAVDFEVCLLTFDFPANPAPQIESNGALEAELVFDAMACLHHIKEWLEIELFLAPCWR